MAVKDLAAESWDGEDRNIVLSNWTDYTLLQHPGAWAILKEFGDYAGNGRNDNIFTARDGTGGNNASADPGVYIAVRPTGSPLTTWTKSAIEERAADWLRVARGDFFGNNNVDIVAVDYQGVYGPTIYNSASSWAATDVAEADSGRQGLVATVPISVLAKQGSRQAFIVWHRLAGAYMHWYTGSTWTNAAIGYKCATHPPDEEVIWTDIDGDGNVEMVIANSDLNTGLMADARAEWVRLGA